MQKRPSAIKWLLGLMLALAAVYFIPAALAQDAFVIQADKLDLSKLGDSAYVQDRLSAGTQYIRVTYALNGSAQVRLHVARSDTGSVVLDKDYGTVTGTFRSDDVYLKYSSSATIPYTITLSVGGEEITFPFYRKLMLLKNNTASTFGVRIKTLDRGLTDAWTMATPLDLAEIAALPGGVKRIDLCASNMYVVGSVSVRVRDGALRVSMQLAEGTGYEVIEEHLYLITNPSQWDSVDPKRTSLTEYEVGVDIPLQDNLPDVRYVVLYLPMKLTYDPNGLERFSYDTQNDPELIRELEIWDEMKEIEKQDSVG